MNTFLGGVKHEFYLTLSLLRNLKDLTTLFNMNYQLKYSTNRKYILKINLENIALEVQLTHIHVYVEFRNDNYL